MNNVLSHESANAYPTLQYATSALGLYQFIMWVVVVRRTLLFHSCFANIVGMKKQRITAASRKRLKKYIVVFLDLVHINK